MQAELYTKALGQLMSYVEREEFKGYDPYDTLNSPFKFSKLGKWPPVIATQIQKRNWINIRPLLGIKKEYNPKAIGLFLYGYCLLQQHDKSKDHSRQISFCFNYLKQNYSKGYSGFCWGYNFDWASPKKYVKAFHSNVVVTAFVAKGLFAYFQLTKDAEARKMLEGACEFILKDLHRTGTAEGICFSYTTLEKDCCYNASLLAATVLSQVYTLNGNEELKTLATQAMDLVVSKQFDNGKWNYSCDPVSGMEREQIDFHQGYVIDALFEIARNCNIYEEKYKEAIRKGAAFYRKEQFFENGRSKWRIPKEYPVEIHNQSQGIITFNRLSDKSYGAFAETIAKWTIENMQDKKGFFYYRKLRLITNKIPYMRWAQAWMFVALVELTVLPAEEKFYFPKTD